MFITKQGLHEILTTAVEGGSCGMASWANDTAEGTPANPDGLQVATIARDKESWVTEIRFVKAAVEEVAGKSVLTTLKTTPEGLVIVDAAALRKALVAIHNGKVSGAEKHFRAQARDAYFNYDNADIDALDADAFVQAALFGEVVYG